MRRNEARSQTRVLVCADSRRYREAFAPAATRVVPIIRALVTSSISLACPPGHFEEQQAQRKDRARISEEGRIGQHW